MSEEKPVLSRRKAKRQIITKDNRIEDAPSPDMIKPVRRKTKFYWFMCVMLLLNGVVYSSWLTDIFGNHSEAPKTLAKNLPNPNNKAKDTLPGDFDLPPQNPPIDTGYNASSRQFPPGAMPQGVTLPYGSSYNPAITQNSGERSAIQGYGTNDGVRQQFTGYQRDAEAGLDYAQNRYYNPQHGRFTSVDPDNYQARLDISNPQSWNAYAYVNNRPTIDTDPTGKCGTLKFWQCIGNKITYGRFKSNDEIQAEADRYRREYQGNLLQIGDRDLRGVDWNTVSNAEVLYIHDGLKGTTIEIQKPDNPVVANVDVTAPHSPQIDIQPPSIDIPSQGGINSSSPGDVSKRNLKHISKHLPEFQKLDSSMTIEKVVDLGQKIASKAGNLVGTPGGRKVFEEVVDVGGRQVKVRAVLNQNGGLRSVHIRD